MGMAEILTTSLYEQSVARVSAFHNCRLAACMMASPIPVNELCTGDFHFQGTLATDCL